MNHKQVLLSMLVVTAVCTTAVSVQAQADSTLYVVANCMQSESPDYVRTEREIWQPIHQEMVDRGQIAGWALYEVRFGDRSECDYYTVDRYRGSEALDNAFSNLDEIFAKVHPDADMDEAMARSLASRKHKASYLLAVIGGVPPESFRYAHVNWMNAPDAGAYVNLEMTLFTPVHRALVDAGTTKGWLLEELVKPRGTSASYNFVTVDFVDSLAPIQFGQYLKKVHPDRDLGEMWDQTDAARDMVRSETWRLVARTTP